MRASRVIAGMGCLLLFVVIVFWYPHEERSPRPDPVPSLLAAMDKERESLQARMAAIRAEVHAISSGATANDVPWAQEWAGIYETNNGRGMHVTLAIAPQAGVAFTWVGRSGLLDANHGDIVETFADGVRVQLAIDTPLSRQGFMHQRLYFVRWGEQRFLVPESQMLELVNTYNRGGLARSEMQRIPRWRSPGMPDRPLAAEPDQPPQLPAPFSNMLLTAPVRLIVTAVFGHEERFLAGDEILHTLDVHLAGGRNRGMHVGMETPVDAGDRIGTLKITSVDEATSRGEFTVSVVRHHNVRILAVGDEVIFNRADAP
jgi:hypothetical protein